MNAPHCEFRAAIERLKFVTSCLDDPLTRQRHALAGELLELHLAAENLMPKTGVWYTVPMKADFMAIELLHVEDKSCCSFIVEFRKDSAVAVDAYVMPK